MKQTLQLQKASGSEASPLRHDRTKAGLIKLGVAAGVLLLAACASVPPPPSQSLQAAETAIATADRARVSDAASPELAEARQNLTAARSAVQKEDMVLAQRLAEQSRANAELATARAETAKAGAVNNEMQKSIDTLKQEMQRNAGARQ